MVRSETSLRRDQCDIVAVVATCHGRHGRAQSLWPKQPSLLVSYAAKLTVRVLPKGSAPGPRTVRSRSIAHQHEPRQFQGLSRLPHSNAPQSRARDTPNQGATNQETRAGQPCAQASLERQPRAANPVKGRDQGQPLNRRPLESPLDRQASQ